MTRHAIRNVMALTSSHIQRFLLGKLHSRFSSNHRNPFAAVTCTSRCYSAIAIDAPSSLAEAPGVRWGSIALQGLREEMEDDIIVRPDGLHGFSFAAVFDGHGGFSSVEFLRDELYKECLEALQGGLGEEDESGATATAVFVGDDTLLVSHIGDSSVVLSRAGKAEMLTSPHRPYGRNKASLQEIKRIREAGGWMNCDNFEFQFMIVNGRICGDIAVSRAFGDLRYKTKKNEYTPNLFIIATSTNSSMLFIFS
ncbi:hypothetical protein Ahy_A07g034125 isoform A [Arachis hypogaea]|uniref:protein-serine/threonine phosphatase n=1 Tax=Arachis hypogaea TaxID=3818 RepID=A0A445CB15_ARAHY|nr:hypothetical protein Ahy_A07g034125 isoform A [Arachis hypogaea]